MTSRVPRLTPILAILVILLSACVTDAGGTSQPPSTAESAAAEPSAAPSVEPTGLTAVYVSTGPIGVNPFLQLIADGAEQGGADFGVEVDVVESTDLAALEDNLRAEAEAGTDLIITNSFDSVDAVTRLSEEFPDQQWAIVDIGIEGNDNVRGLVFREHEGAFLVGALFGLLASGEYDGYPASERIGAVGAMDIPPIRRWYVGFEEGVAATAPDVEVSATWANSFNDSATSKELALAHHDAGAEYIFAFAAAGNFGIFEAAQEEGFFTSGVDQDQRGVDPEHILESVVKRTDIGVYEAIEALANGSFSGGFVDYGLSENGVGPAFLVLEDPDPPVTLPQEVQDRIRELADGIISGDIVVTDHLASGG